MTDIPSCIKARTSLLSSSALCRPDSQHRMSLTVY